MGYVTSTSKMGRRLNSPKYRGTMSAWLPHEGAKQQLKAEFMLDANGNKMHGLHYSESRETIVNTAGQDVVGDLV